MYLEANLSAKSEKDAFEIPRKLLVNNESVFVVVNDTVLSLVKVNPVYFNDQSVVIKGLPNGSVTLTKNVPGAYDGMIIKIIDESKTDSKQ